MSEEERVASTARPAGRDWFLLPLIAVLTPVILLFSANLMLRPIYKTTNHRLAQCLDYAHPAAGIPSIPNCTTYDKSFDTPLVKYEFNQCGLRSESGCAESTPGVYTIALMGSSVPLGQWVPFHQSIAAKLKTDLEETTHHEISVENFSRMEEFPEFVPELLPRVLNSKPDMILLVLSPYDIQVSSGNPIEMMETAKLSSTNRFTFWRDYFWNAFFGSSLSQTLSAVQLPLRNVENKSRIGTFVINLMYHDKARYVRQFLMGEDSGTGYLSNSPSGFWTLNYLKFGNSMQTAARIARLHHIAYRVVLIPSRPQEAMLNSGAWPAGYDPYFLDRKVQSLVTASGGTFLDIFPACARMPNLERHYYVQNGHPDGVAQTQLAQLIAQALLKNPPPALMGTAGKQQSTKGSR